MAKNKRKWLRFPKDIRTVTLKLDAENSRTADVVDESYGGIAIELKDISRLNIGCEIDVEYGASEMKAVIRYVRTADAPVDGRQRIGLEWLEPPSAPKAPSFD